MCVMLIQCFGCAQLAHHRGARTGRAQLVEPCDALLAVLVDHVALSLDERGFVQIAQLVEPEKRIAPQGLGRHKDAAKKN